MYSFEPLKGRDTGTSETIYTRLLGLSRPQECSDIFNYEFQRTCVKTPGSANPYKSQDTNITLYKGSIRQLHYRTGNSAVMPTKTKSLATTSYPNPIESTAQPTVRSFHKPRSSDLKTNNRRKHRRLFCTRTSFYVTYCEKIKISN